MWLDSN